jgi:ABC-2 type transport system ATP-binding protein
LAQALINDPDLVILDEPTAGLDPIGCREVKDLILALAARGKTVILSSHLLADVEDVCDRVVIYYGGRVQAMGTLKDLLVNRDSVRITTPALTRETLERVLETIRRDVAEDAIKIDNPTQNLESYFLEVVQKAKQSAAETSGATAGGQVAAYLRGEAEARPASEKLLDRLTLPASAKEPPSAAAAEAEPSLAQAKLETLTKPTEPTPTKPRAEPSKPADLAKANERLESLLRKPK